VKNQEQAAQLAALFGQKLELQARANQQAIAQAQRQAPPADRRRWRPGERMGFPVRRGGVVVGTVDAHLDLGRAFTAVMSLARGGQGDIPFAVDADHELHTPRPADRQKLADLGVPGRVPDGTVTLSGPNGDWILVAQKDQAGVVFGIARPIGGALRDMRRAAAQNLGIGLAVVALAFIGIIPVSRRMTRNLSILTDGVHRIAQGDLKARVMLRSRDEFGMLGQAVNQMAQDLEAHEAVVVRQERLKRELELCREIQNEMLPHESLRFGLAEVKGISIPAREVGGDFFNYFLLSGGDVALLVGDVSGKGVGAALLMAHIQATLLARLPLDRDLAHLVDAIDREMEKNTPRGVYLTLFVGIFDPKTNELRYVNAGHNPQFVLRAGGALEPLASTGLPVGMFAGHGYEQRAVSLGARDLLFFYTDGIVEVENEAGEMFGAERLGALLGAGHDSSVDGLLAEIDGAVRTFRGGAELFDDATMMVLRLGAEPQQARA
jgi:serine phosphatase RsbU (regulator of sigma subunit)